MALSGISNESLADLIATTQKNLPKLQIEYALKYQTYEVINRWFKADRVQFDSGTSVLRTIVLDASGNAKHVRLYQETKPNVADVVSQLEVPWRQAQVDYSIERREALRNSAPARFVDLVKTRRNEALIGLANLLEERAWQPPDSSSDDLNPFGIPYWIPKLASGAGEGFYGGSYTTYASTTAGIDPATSGDNTTSIAGGKSLWRSYCAGGTGYYEAMNATAVRTLTMMFLKINFEAPDIATDENLKQFADYRIYCNANTYVAASELARQNNDQIGADLGMYLGAVVFHRLPFKYVAYLDADTTNPIYMVNHKVFYPFVQTGDYLREEKPIIDPRMHNVLTTYIDLSYNFIALNRRRLGVMNLIA